MGKYLTIVLITEKTSKVKKIRIPINLLIFFSIVVVGALSFTGYIFHYYYTDPKRDVRIDDLRALQDKKKLKINRYHEDLKIISLNFDRLDETKKKMEVLTSFELTGNTASIRANEKKLLKKYYANDDRSILNIIDNVDTDNRQAQSNKLAYYKSFVDYMENSRRQYLHFSPTGVPAKGIILSGFRYETDPFASPMRLPDGITIGVHSLDVRIVSTGDGIVSMVGSNDFKGNFVEIYHNASYKTRYSLLGDISTTVGSVVKKGQEIGTAGKSEYFPTPHYHYEVVLFGVSQNPNKYRSHEYLEDILR